MQFLDGLLDVLVFGSLGDGLKILGSVLWPHRTKCGLKSELGRHQAHLIVLDLEGNFVPGFKM